MTDETAVESDRRGRSWQAAYDAFQQGRSIRAMVDAALDVADFDALEAVAVAAQALLDAREAVIDAVVNGAPERERHTLQVAAKYATNALRTSLDLLEGGEK